MGLPFLGSIPLATDIRTLSDSGKPIVISNPNHPAAKAFMRVAENLAAQVSMAGFREDEAIQPLVWSAGGAPAQPRPKKFTV
jgi:MinD-like ATPase involved in chromosome partitioning or flagellar assembly